MRKAVLFSTSVGEASLMDFLDRKSKELRMSKSSIIKYGIRKLYKRVRSTGEIVFKIDTVSKSVSEGGQVFSYSLGKNDSDIEEFLVEMQQAGLNNGLVSKIAIRLLMEEDNHTNSIDLMMPGESTPPLERKHDVLESPQDTVQDNLDKQTDNNSTTQKDSEEIVITEAMKSNILFSGISAK